MIKTIDIKLIQFPIRCPYANKRNVWGALIYVYRNPPGDSEGNPLWNLIDKNFQIIIARIDVSSYLNSFYFFNMEKLDKPLMFIELTLFTYY